MGRSIKLLLLHWPLACLCHVIWGRSALFLLGNPASWSPQSPYLSWDCSDSFQRVPAQPLLEHITLTTPNSHTPHGFEFRCCIPSPISCPSALTSSFTLQLIWVDLSIPVSCGASAGPALEDSIAAEMWWLPEDSSIFWTGGSIFGFRMWAVI